MAMHRGVITNLPLNITESDGENNEITVNTKLQTTYVVDNNRQRRIASVEKSQHFLEKICHNVSKTSVQRRGVDYGVCL